MKTLCGAVFGTLLALQGWAQGPKSEIEKHIQAAQSAQERGDLETAAQEYRSVLKVQPNSAEAYRNLGLLAHLQNKPAECAALMRQALSLKPGIAGANLYLGISTAKQNHPELAVSFLSKAQQQEPNSKEAASWLAKSLWDSGHSGEALNELERAGKALPEDLDLLFLLGEAYRKSAALEFETIAKTNPSSLFLGQGLAESLRLQGQPDKAIRQYQKLLARDGRWKGAHLGEGSVFLSEGKLDEAEKQFQEELSIEANSVAPKVGLAEVALLRGHVDDCLQSLHEAIAANPEAARSLLRSADSALFETAPAMRKRYLSAVAELRTQFEADPAALHFALGIVFARLGNQAALTEENNAFGQAVGPPSTDPSPRTADLLALAEKRYESREYREEALELRRLVMKNPTLLKARYLLGKCYEALAVQTLSQLAEQAPDSYRAHQLLGQIYRSQGQNDKALAEFRIVARMQPTLPGLHYAIGDLLWAIGQSDEALVELSKELDLNPNHAEASAALGSIYVSRGEAMKGLRCLQKAIDLQPDLLAARRELGRAYFQLQDFEKAKVQLRQSLSIDDDGSIHYMLGNVYRELGQMDEAMKMMETAAQMKATNGPSTEEPGR